MKKEKGITLVALVITIIILLILAGITINFTIGQNGILEKATTAKNDTNKAKIEEEFYLLVTEYNLDENQTDFKTFIKSKDPDAIYRENSNIVTYKGVEIELDKDSLSSKGNTTSNRLYLYNEGTENATIDGWSDIGEYSKETNHIYVTLKDDSVWFSRSAAIGFSDIDTSGYKHLIIELEDMYCNSSDMSLFVAYNGWIPTDNNYDYWNQTYDGTDKRTLDINLEEKNLTLTDFHIGWCCGSAQYFMAQNWGTANGATGEAYFKLKNVYLY